MSAAGFPVPFGKYLLTELIAVGGMAEIYRAKIFGVNGFEKQMVVKRILPKYAQNPSFVQMFEDEAKILVSLTHGNIVPVYELGEVGGNYYIAMEYAEGLTALDVLRECYLKGKSLTPAQALYIGAEVAKGLGYAHTRTDANGTPLGIVHRDLNPRNIVVSPAGEVKILDFGIARSSKKKHQTGSGIIKGTPGYMAPEQVMGQTVDQRADQYGLAIIIHELLTVRRLISVKDAPEHRAFLQRGPLPVPSSFRSEIPTSVDQVMMKALSTRPEERYQSVLDFEDALRGEIARLGVAVTSRGLSNTIAEIKSSPALDPSQFQSRPGHTKPTTSNASTGAPPMSSPPVQVTPQVPPASSPSSAVSGTNHPVVAADFTEPRRSRPITVPSLPVATGAAPVRPQTQVLALNAGVDWAQNIGKDAELLALAQASGIKSKTPQRTLLGLVAAVILMVGAWAGLNPDEVGRMLDRARSGKGAVTATLVVKSRPSGAVVSLGGTERGKTNLRLEQLDMDKPMELVITLPDGREMKRMLSAADFTGSERKLEVMFDTTAAADAGPPPK